MEKKSASFLEKFTILKSAPRELWIIYIQKVLEIIAYGLMSSTIILWLSSDLKYSDASAGDLIAIWSTIISLFTVLVGSFTDAVGIRKAFLMGFVICLVSRGVMAFSTTEWIVLPFGMLLLAMGLALMIPVMTAATKRYSNTAQRSMAFSMYYVLMNVGFAIAGWLFDKVRTHLGEYGTYNVPILNVDLSTYQTLFLLSFLATIPGLLVVMFFLRSGVEMTEEGVVITPREPKYQYKNPISAILAIVKETSSKTAHIFIEVWKTPAFYRFLLFLSLIVGVRVVFYHMHYTFPKYGIRELGDGAKIGNLWSVLNPMIIVILVPIIGALAQKIKSYTMIVVGSFISATSVFLLVIPPSFYQPLADSWFGSLIGHAWLGLEGPVHPLNISITVFVFIFSIGEAIWSPRLYEYTASIAPKGQEASYMSLSILPYFFAKFFVGLLSGRLLATYCPAEGPKDSETMWLIIGVMAVVSPIGIFLLRKYISGREEGRE